MCIAVVDYTGVTEEWFQAAESENPHGFGMAWTARTGRVIVQRSMVASWSQYAKARKANRDRPMILHFRLATWGPKTVSQCHPFVIRPDTAFAHNGMFPEYQKNKRMSDTQALAKALRGRDPKAKAVREYLDYLCKSYNKLVFLTRGQPIIFGEQHGHWSKNGNWYSYREGNGPLDYGTFYCSKFDNRWESFGEEWWRKPSSVDKKTKYLLADRWAKC